MGCFITGWRPNGSSDEAKVFGAVRRGLSETVDCRVFNFFVVKCYSSTQDSVLKKERIIDLPPKYDDSFSTWLDLAILRLCILSPKIAVFGTLVVWWHQPKTHSNYSPSVRPIYKHLPILPGECCRQILSHREIVLTLFFIPGKQRSLEGCWRHQKIWMWQSDRIQAAARIGQAPAGYKKYCDHKLPMS